MQVNGNPFWMQNWAQQNTNARVNPLLEQVQNVMAQYGDTEASGAISNEMGAKLRQLEKESKVDPSVEEFDRIMKSLPRLEWVLPTG